MRCAALLFAVLLLASTGTAQPASGLYLTLRDDFMAPIAEDIGLATSNYVNADTSFPTQSGSNSEVTYTLSSFVMNMNLDGFNLTAAQPPMLTVSYGIHLRSGGQGICLPTLQLQL
jgi:hypothetical protein